MFDLPLTPRLAASLLAGVYASERFATSQSSVRTSAWQRGHFTMKTPFRSSVDEMYVTPPALSRQESARNW